MLSAQWRAGEGGPGRKYYALTKDGRQALSSQAEAWAAFADAVSSVLPVQASTKRSSTNQAEGSAVESRLLPFWSSRELGTFAIDGPNQGSLTEGLAHAAIVVALCAVLIALRLRRHRVPVDPSS